MSFSNSNALSEQLTPFLTFNRQQWAELRKSVPLKLTEQDLKPLLGFNEELSLNEVSTIYLPLTRLINYYIEENLRRQTVLKRFLSQDTQKTPYIISIAGSVAVGKSTSARILQSLLANWPQVRRVDLITTDGFLYPLEKLKAKNILDKKGFPISYDTQRLIHFLADIKSGKRNVKAPIYSHLTYDIVRDKFDIVDQPDILILEGLNVLQQSNNHTNQVFVSDFVDFSIFVDAEEILLKKWYIHRFLKLRRSAFSNPNSYFKHYASLSEQEAIQTASKIWDEINGKNLRDNILPTKERANLILIKGENHIVEKVKLRK
ncbi:type I pantothenate kinase [Avibacterium paragallinarum]|uniref:Pantothenate kinase n=1 Tax=Avibacterium paragallinarum TaxID=728 RepID=A0AAE5WHV9_AVIPA|nr:type I pantothenate kinase [Avibacterium paragallinarum]MEE3607839.1 type I pantothenate kinase [Avibacterium paragallinarum]MEE3621847.1 type I pantothenate kinase [Avibacterium paragallinarum]MEE3669648.1 type I pantothenate kinase [Avibacterium paragallinarum]MEE3681264.1 type I pantothenate kinase [Avibacterium paragallinarum]MEE4386123.1 type I pantothenate kinase [Avibacterium paragallinarum]